MKYAFIDLLGDIGKWFVIGLLISGLISYLIPDNMIETYLGNNFLAMLVMLITGIPMYVCATSSTPIAAALVLKGLNPGAALVFLLAGPATNIASLSMVYKMLVIFFQAEDGIRDDLVTGVQTCALPINDTAYEMIW